MRSFPKKSQGLIPNPIQNLMGTLEYDYTMKVRSREGVMRQRPPKKILRTNQDQHIRQDQSRSLQSSGTCSNVNSRKTIKLLVFFTLVAILPRLANGSPCGYDEMYQCDNGDCSCVKCLMCPPGQGLYPQCGSTLKENVTMKCLPCKDGTYSKQNDFESCHPCHICDGQETLQKCRATQNAVCKEGCLAGYKWDEFLHMCRKSKKNPTNPQKSTTTKPSAELLSLNVTKSRINDSMNASGPNEGVNKPTQGVATSVKTPNAPHKYSWMRIEIAIYVFVVVFLLGLLAFGYWKREKIVRFLCHLYCSCSGNSQTDQQDPVETAPMNPDAAEEENVELNDIRVEDIDRSRGDVEDRNAGHSGQQGGSPGHSTQALRSDHQFAQPGQGLKKAVISRSDHSGQQGESPGHSTQALRSDHQFAQPGQGLKKAVISRSDHSGQQGESPGHSTQAPSPDHQFAQPGQGLDKAVIPISDHSGQQGLVAEKAIAKFDNPNHSGSLLTELSPELKVGISVHLYKEHQPGWKEIGRVYNIPPQKLEEFQARSKASSGDKLPGEFLFEYLEGSKPKLTVLKFLHALKAIGRNDIICFISEEYFKSHLGHSSDST